MRLSLIDKIFHAFVSARGEKRKEPRREDELPVEIEILSDETSLGPTRVLYAQIKDISAGGVKILTNIYIPLDTPIKLKITLSKLRETISPVGKIVWGNQIEDSDVYEMGIEFENTQPDILCTLLEYIYSKWD
ncbi:MAG: PilZ domain-containing protein [Candidatus Aminicenantes bacterium]|nr:MAG: PilZ domain-containing protein [Candidatus Aminicenantes bacterium]